MASPDEPAEGGDQPVRGRLAYEKPTIAWEQPLVERTSLMAGCGKTPSTPGEDCSSSGLYGS